MKIYGLVPPDPWFIKELHGFNPKLNVKSVYDTNQKSKHWEIFIKVAGTEREGLVMDWKHPYLSMAIIARLSKMDIHRRYKSLRAYLIKIEQEKEVAQLKQKAKQKEDRVDMFKEYGKDRLMAAMEHLVKTTQRR